MGNFDRAKSLYTEKLRFCIALSPIRKDTRAWLTIDNECVREIKRRVTLLRRSEFRNSPLYSKQWISNAAPIVRLIR